MQGELWSNELERKEHELMSEGSSIWGSEGQGKGSYYILSGIGSFKHRSNINWCIFENHHLSSHGRNGLVEGREHGQQD